MLPFSWTNVLLGKIDDLHESAAVEGFGRVEGDGKVNVDWQAGKRWCASSTSNYQETLEEGKTPRDSKLHSDLNTHAGHQPPRTGQTRRCSDGEGRGEERMGECVGMTRAKLS